MVNFSWRQWLQGKNLLPFRLQRRQRPECQTLQIEGLELRTMLTAPVAVDDSGYVVNEDGTLNSGTSVLDNDTDPDSNPITTATLDADVTHGSLTLNPDGTFVYTPLANFHGTDSFTYFATDNQGETSGTAATVTITVNPLNDSGMFGGDTSGSGDEDTTLTGTLTFTDAADGFTTPNFAVTTPATNGSASIDAATGAWSYTPGANYHGADSFTVSVTDDDGNIETQVISLTVNSVNDVGTFGGDVSGTGNEDTSITGTLTYSDLDGFTTPDFTVSVSATNGTASIDLTTGAWTYTPTANFHGADSFTVSVTDDDGNVLTQVIGLTVSSVNDPGMFGGDTSGNGSEDANITGTLTFADAIDGFTTPNFAVSVDAAHGTASIDPTTGAWTYTPAANYFGPDSFTVRVTDDDGFIETQVITLTVITADDNDLGTFGGDTSGTGDEDTDITGSLTFTDPDGFTTPNFTVSVAAVNGSASIDPTTGAWTYTPSANYHGADSFTVSVTDDEGNVQTQVISLTVNSINDQGTFGGDTGGTGVEDTSITGTLTFADAADGFTTPDFTITVDPTNGTASIDQTTGAWTYTPAANYYGADSFTVSVTDDEGNVQTQVITLTVTSANDNDPGTFGGDSSGTGDEDTDITGTLTFTDPDGFTTPDFTVSITPLNGSASIDPTSGAWTYTPAANYHGSDSFTVSVTDDEGNVQTQVISLTVNSIADVGVFGGDTSGSGDEDTVIIGTLTYLDGDGFTTPDFTVTVAATSGSASIDLTTGAWTYTPGANFHGSDSFTVSVTDDDGNVQTQVISLTVNSVNDPGAFGGDTSGSGVEDTNITGTLTFTDLIDGATTPDYTVSVDPTNGTATIDPTTGAWTYSPTANYFGSDSFTVSVTDDDGHVEIQVITLTINSANDNDPGTFGGNTSGTGDEDTVLTGTLTFSDPDGFMTPDFTVSVNPTNGTASIDLATGAWTYTPTANYHGPDSFTVSVTDNEGNVQTQVISLTVNSVNDAGTFGGDISGVGIEDTSITGTLTFADAIDGFTTPNFTVSVDPTNGTASIDPTTGAWIYTPNANYFGSDSFTVSVTDDDGHIETQVITLTVASANDNDLGTFGGDTTGTGDEDTVIAGTLTFNDPDGFTTPDFTVSVNPVNGTATINLNTGVWTYTPAGNYNGPDSFTVSVTDDEGNVQTQVITVSVNAVNDAGAFGGDISGAGDEDNDIAGTLTFADTADGFTTPNFTVSVGATHGTASIDLSTGAWTYTPNANYHGADSFTVSVTDDDGHVETQVITLTVAPVNDLGTFGGDTSDMGDEDTALTGTLTFNDPDGFTTPNFTVSVNPTNGTASIDLTTGAWTYTPNANYHGSDSFTVSVTDDDGNVQTQVISLTVNSVNDPGTFGGATSGSGNEDTNITGTLTFTDAIDGSTTPAFVVSVNPAHGTAGIDPVTGAWTYIPAANYFGADSFTVSVTDDDGHVETQVISVTVIAVTDLIAGDDSFTTPHDTQVTGTVAGNDSTTSGGSLSYAVATNVSHGVLVLNPNGSFTYTPTANYSGSDSFTYEVTDAASGESLIRTVTITVTPNNAPTVSNGSGTVSEDAFLFGSVSPLGLDPDGDPLTYVVVTPPAHGTLTLSPDGTFTYIPNANYFGTDSFTFKANDGLVDSGIATFSITVTSFDDPLQLSLPSGPIDVGNTSTPVQLDPAASVNDPDTSVSYANAQVQVSIISGGTQSDFKHGRVTLKINNQGTGAGLVKVKGSKIYFDGSSTAIAKFSGGKNGNPLVLTFTSAATQDAVNAVLKQITMQASKRATPGNLTLGVQVIAGGQITTATKTATIS